MLTSLTLDNVTVFERAELELGPGINVIIGDNGTGKSQLLKVMYAALATLYEGGRAATAPSAPTKASLQRTLADKLVSTLRPERLGRLARWGSRGAAIEVGVSGERLAWSFTPQSEVEVVVHQLPSTWQTRPPVFLPPRELMTLYPGFLALYDGHYTEFDETFRDTCVLLGGLAKKGDDEKAARRLLKPLELAMGGKVELDPKVGRFYLRTKSQRVEMPLVAEGLRKLAMLARLIATGALIGDGVLFWDEPEANLNPRALREVARVLCDLARGGLQVFIASHSLFLLRELFILEETEFKGLGARYFGLALERDGDRPRVTISTGAALHELDVITSLEESLAQSHRFLEADNLD